jgi:glycine/sarcosine N-methyltransferase
MAREVQESYDELADHYHLNFENWQATIDRQAGLLAPLLEKECGPASRVRVLDCACGIGTQTLGLAARGFRMTASDLSPKAVERARREAAQRKLDIRFRVANMLDLASLGESRFDAVICMDNTLPHLESTEQLAQAAQQMRNCLRPDGLLMASIRDYDRLVGERPAMQAPAFYSDQGQCRIVFQVWDWKDERGYVFHLYITSGNNNRWQTFHTCAAYRAVLRDELTAVLGDTGFKNIRWLIAADSGFYQPIVLATAE